MTEHHADVAVVIPNYNSTKTLRACLDAVYAQTYPPAEVIVVDDASTDTSPSIAREYPCTLVELAGNRGPAGARNAGVAASTAPLLFFVDADTALAPDAIGNAVQAYRDTPDCGMVQGIYAPEPLFDDGPVERYRVACEHFERKHSVATFLSCSLVSREVFHLAGGLDERLRDGEDFEFGTRVPARYRLVVTDTVVTRADDVDRFWPCLWERFVRASTMPVIMLRARRRSEGAGFRLDMIGPARHDRRRPPGISSAAAATVVLLVPTALFVPWLWLALPPLLTLFLHVNRELLGFARELRGNGFAVFVAGMQLTYHASFFFGAGVGVFRVLYELARGQSAAVRPGESRTLA